MSNPQVFVIVCHDKETNTFEELSGAFVERRLAEDAKKNLDLNFPQFEHRIKVLSLQGVANDIMNHRLYCFSKKENE